MAHSTEVFSFFMEDSPSSPFFLIAVEFIDIALFVVVNAEGAAGHDGYIQSRSFCAFLEGCEYA